MVSASILYVCGGVRPKRWIHGAGAVHRVSLVTTPIAMDDAPMVREETYELLTLSPVLDSDDARTALLARIVALVSDAGGAVITNRVFARQQLAYPIDRHAAGEYLLVEFRGPTSIPAQVSRELRLMNDVLRAQVTVKSAKTRVVGADVAAMERVRAQRDAAARAAASVKSVTADQPPDAIANLDEKLEEILGKEMI